MLSLGGGELLLAMLLALVVVGPERLPEILRWMGRQYGWARRTLAELQRELMLEDAPPRQAPARREVEQGEDPQDREPARGGDDETGGRG